MGRLLLLLLQQAWYLAPVGVLLSGVNALADNSPPEVIQALQKCAAAEAARKYDLPVMHGIADREITLKGSGESSTAHCEFWINQDRFLAHVIEVDLTGAQSERALLITPECEVHLGKAPGNTSWQVGYMGSGSADPAFRAEQVKRVCEFGLLEFIEVSKAGEFQIAAGLLEFANKKTVEMSTITESGKDVVAFSLVDVEQQGGKPETTYARHLFDPHRNWLHMGLDVSDAPFQASAPKISQRTEYVPEVAVPLRSFQRFETPAYVRTWKLTTMEFTESDAGVFVISRFGLPDLAQHEPAKSWRGWWILLVALLMAIAVFALKKFSQRRASAQA